MSNLILYVILLHYNYYMILFIFFLIILEHHSEQAVFERRFEVSGPPPYIVNELLHFGLNLVQGTF